MATYSSFSTLEVIETEAVSCFGHNQQNIANKFLYQQENQFHYQETDILRKNFLYRKIYKLFLK